MAKTLTTGVLLKRGFRRRCPVCGQGKIFQRWVNMADSCPRCALVFCRVEGQWLGSWFLNIFLSEALTLGVVLGGVMATYPNPPFALLAIAGALTTVGFPIWFFPYSRTIWLSIDLAMRPLEFDEGVEPQFELEADLARFRDDDSR